MARGTIRLAAVLTGALSAAMLAAACGSTATKSGPSVATPAPPAALVAEARPIGRGPRFQPPARGPVLGACTRRLGARDGVHLEVFGANRVVIVPTGIGTRQPLQFSAGRIAGAGCYGEVVTLDPTGVLLVRPGARLVLADLFRSWGEPLSRRRLASFTASPRDPVAVFVDGRPWRGLPAAVPLRRHSEIVLEVGPHVPPHTAYTFPPGT
ncbi:MAG: hypothetical protein WAN22_01465 [Solirubrobacteraceae bacterium]